MTRKLDELEDEVKDRIYELSTAQKVKLATHYISGERVRDPSVEKDLMDELVRRDPKKNQPKVPSIYEYEADDRLARQGCSSYRGGHGFSYTFYRQATRIRWMSPCYFLALEGKNRSSHFAATKDQPE